MGDAADDAGQDAVVDRSGEALGFVHRGKGTGGTGKSLAGPALSGVDAAVRGHTGLAVKSSRLSHSCKSRRTWLPRRPVGAASAASSSVIPRRSSARTLRQPLVDGAGHFLLRSEEHTSELQSLMRISYA